MSKQNLHFFEIASKSLKMSYINEKSLYIFVNSFKSLGFFEKAPNYFKKASVPLKMSS
jgi:hypothetical protein